MWAPEVLKTNKTTYLGLRILKSNVLVDRRSIDARLPGRD